MQLDAAERISELLLEFLDLRRAGFETLVDGDITVRTDGEPIGAESFDQIGMLHLVRNEDYRGCTH